MRILIADDHAIVREGLRALIATEAGMALAGEAADGLAAVQLYRALRPDVVLLDLMMPRMNGIEAIVEIMAIDPQARILVLTSFAEDDQVFPAIKCGAKGYLLKDSMPGELLQAIHEVYQGEAFLDPVVARKLVVEMRRGGEPERVAKKSVPRAEASGRADEKAGFPQEALSEREQEVLRLVAEGLSNQDIAGQLVISERTVRNHVGSILAKLHLANRTQAALYAVRSGYQKQE
jgi:NarL family two-component system response regulator LiaR